MGDWADVLVTFLGAPRSGYRSTTYRWGAEEHATRFCPVALARFFDPKRVAVVLTPEARRQSFPAMAGELARLDTPVQALDLAADAPSPLWHIFDTITAAVAPEEAVLFDVTYGFRYMPMLMVLASQFLAVTRQVRTTGIYYGAFDQSRDGTTPVVDLTPLAELMTWTQSAAHFAETGNAGPLVDQLGSTGGPGSDVEQQLRNVSRFLRLGVSTRVGQEVSALLRALHAVPQPDEGPLDEVAALVEAKYRLLALEDDPEKRPFAQLRQQSALVQWYVTNDLALQGLLLAREWLVSYVAHLLDEAHWLQSDVRTEATQLLHSAANEARPEHEAALSTLMRTAADLKVVSLWKEVADLRNEVAHMSMRPLLRPVGEIRRGLRQIAAGIEAISTTFPSARNNEELDYWLNRFGES